MPEASGGGSDGAAAGLSEDVRRLIAGLDAWEEGVTGLATKLRRDHRAATCDEAAASDASTRVVRLGPVKNFEGLSYKGPGSFSTAASHITAHRHQHHHPLPIKRSSLSLLLPLASTCSISTTFAPLATATILHRSQDKVGSLPAPSFDKLPGGMQPLLSSAQPLNECSREPDAGISQSSSVSTTPSPRIAAMLEAPKAYTDVRRSSADAPGSDTRRSSTTAPRRLPGSTQRSLLAAPLEASTTARGAVPATAGNSAVYTPGDAGPRRPGSSHSASLRSKQRALDSSSLENVNRPPRPQRSNQINSAASDRPTRGNQAASASAGTGGRGLSPPCSTVHSRVSVANSNDGRHIRGSAKLSVSGGGAGTGGGSRGAPTTTRARSHARDERAASKQGRRRPQADEPKNALNASSRASVRGIGHDGRDTIKTVREMSRADADDGQVIYPYAAASPPGLQHRAEEALDVSSARTANRGQGPYTSRGPKGASRARLLRQHEQDPGGMKSVDAIDGAEAANVRAAMGQRPEERRDVRPGESLAICVNEEDRWEETARLQQLLGDLMRDAAARSQTPGNPLVHWLMTKPELEAAEQLLRRHPAELLHLLRSGGIDTSRSGCQTECFGDAAAKRLITSLQKELACWTARYDRAVSEAEHRRMQLSSCQAKTKQAARSSAVHVAAAALRVHQLTKENDRLHLRLQELRRYSMRLEHYVLRRHAPPTECDTSTPTTPVAPSSLRSGGAADSGVYAAPGSPLLDLSTGASPSAMDAEVAAVEL